MGIGCDETGANDVYVESDLGLIVVWKQEMTYSTKHWFDNRIKYRGDSGWGTIKQTIDLLLFRENLKYFDRLVDVGKV